MPVLERTYRWERFEPHMGNNRELPPKQRFHLEVASGLSRAQLEAFGETYSAIKLDGDESSKLVAVFSPYVRLGAEPLVADGQPVDSLAKYVDLCLSMPGLFNLLELPQAVTDYNSIGGTFAHFSEWRSGGSSGTRAQSAGQASETTGVR